MKEVPRDILRDSVIHYFNEADAVFKIDPKLADRYVVIARKLAMRHRYRIPRELQLKFCKHCYSYLRAGVNSKRRLTGKTLTISCAACKRFSRYVYLQKSPAKK